jgi:hypothetical protein
MAYQIGLFCMPQLADAECLKADQTGGSASVLSGLFPSLSVIRLST